MSLKCRFCGKNQKKSRDLITIFGPENDKTAKLINKIENYLQITVRKKLFLLTPEVGLINVGFLSYSKQIPNENTLPNKICHNCMKKTQETCQFLQMIEATQESLDQDSKNANMKRTRSSLRLEKQRFSSHCYSFSSAY